MTWAFQGHALAVCTDQTARVKVVAQCPGQGVLRALDLGKGADAAETEWQALAKAFLGLVQKAQPESEAGFRILMAGMMQAMDAEVGPVGAPSGGDEKRAMRIAQYWSVTEPMLGLGELAELLAFMRDYRDLRKDTPNFFAAPKLGGLLRASAGKLLPAAGGACLPLDRLIRDLDRPFNPEARDAKRPGSSARPAPGAKPAGAAEGIPIAAAPAAETKAAEPGPQTPRRYHDEPMTMDELLDTPEREAWRNRQMGQELEDSLALQMSPGALAAGADPSPAKLSGIGMAPMEERKDQ